MQNLLRVLIIGVLWVLGVPAISGHEINLPKSPPLYGYGLVNAFPGVKFAQPVGIASPPGETNSLYIVERLGRIMVIPELNNPEPKVFLDLRESTDTISGEGGLLGLAFHPNYKANGRFFIFRTGIVADQKCNTLSEFQRDAQDPTAADPSSEKLILAQPDFHVWHNAGDLHFGPDGYLYVSVGYDAPEHRVKAQAIDEGLFGGILRIDVDLRADNLAPNSHSASTANYRVPRDNPFVGAKTFNGVAVDPAKVQTEFYAVGLRNPWMFTFAQNTGQLICGDVGDGGWEEINIIEKGKNYGWPFMEGRADRLTNPPPNLALPVYDYAHGSGLFEGTAIIGGVVYRGDSFRDLSGKYLFGDIQRGHLWAIDVNETNPPVWLTASAGVSAFAEDPRDRGVLVANLYKGEINKLAYRLPRASGVPQRLSEVSAFADLGSLKALGSTEYEIISPFWSDGADKRRWLNLESAHGSLVFSSQQAWGVPTGAIFIKHFELEMTKGVPESRRRLETRFLVHSTNGFYGLTYRWNDPGTDAELVPPSGLIETLQVNEGGVTRPQKWYYPSWEQCNLCHNESGRVLGFNTYQLNRTVSRPEGEINQLEWLREQGYFSNSEDVRVDDLPRFSALTDQTAPLQHKVRSYLASNCSQCHQPGGTSGMLWDGRISTPIENAAIINSRSTWYPDPAVMIIAPKSLDRSFMYHRLYHENERYRMPPVASVRADNAFVTILTNWIYRIPDEGWVSKNIGTALLEGSAEQDGRAVQVSSSGPGIEHDGIFFLSKEATGKVEISGRISELKLGVGEVGLMLRASEEPDSPYAAIYVSGTDLIFRVRQEKGGHSQIISKAPARLTGAIGLSRDRDEVTARFKGIDGKWQPLGRRAAQLGGTLRAGFFSASGQIPPKFVSGKFADYSLRCLDFSLSRDEPNGGKISINALEDDASVIGQLVLESSVDMKTWTREPATVSGLNGDILSAERPLQNQKLKFYRIRRAN